MSDNCNQSRPGHESTPEFLRLFCDAQPRLFAYILALVPKWHDAEEILQETSVVLWESFGQFQPGTDFWAWAKTTAFHRVLSFRKRQKRLAVPLSDRFIAAVAEEYGKLTDELEEQLLALAKCVEKLSPEEGQLITACYDAGAVTREVAARLGRPAGTVYKSLTRIRRTLMTCVEQTLSEGDRR
jgi:RNA polymerase sigma-70 factor, ECF subfamily